MGRSIQSQLCPSILRPQPESPWGAVLYGPPTWAQCTLCPPTPCPPASRHVQSTFRSACSGPPVPGLVRVHDGALAPAELSQLTAQDRARGAHTATTCVAPSLPVGLFPCHPTRPLQESGYSWPLLPSVAPCCCPPHSKQAHCSPQALPQCPGPLHPLPVSAVGPLSFQNSAWPEGLRSGQLLQAEAHG